MFYIALSMLMVLLVPGPTNSLLLQSGISRGLSTHSFKLIAAEWLAYVTQITLWGVSIDLLVADYSWIVVATKVFAVCFLFYISLKLWFTATDNTSSATSGITAPELFVATLSNPKGLFFATFVAPAGTFLSADSYVTFMSLFSVVIFPVGLVWVATGAYFGRKLNSTFSGRRVSRSISVVIGLFASLMLFNIASQVVFT